MFKCPNCGAESYQSPIRGKVDYISMDEPLYEYEYQSPIRGKVAEKVRGISPELNVSIPYKG